MDNINDIISSLSNDDIEMLKGVASSLLGGDASSNQESKMLEAPKQNNMLSGLNINAGEIEMMMKAKQIFDKMNASSSKNADLINALKPHLSEASQHKADQAIRIMKLFDVLPYIKDLF